MSKDFVAIVHKLCPICAKQDEGELLLSTRMRNISHLHNKNTGFGQPCAECQSGIDQGAIMHIVVDADLSGDGSLEQIYRTGEVFGLTEEAFRRINKAGTVATESALKSRACIIVL
jgi:hypothetical protein